MNKIKRIGLIAPARTKSSTIYCFNYKMRRWFEENKNVPRFNHPNLALLTIAALTPQEIEIKVIDERVDDINFEEEFDIVGISMMTAQATRGYEVARSFMARGVYIVIGGMHPTVFPEEAEAWCDTLVVGEAENTWPQFLEDFTKGKPEKLYQDQSIDITKSPIPRYDLLDLSKWHLIPMQTTRGCPIDCKFCSVTTVFGPKFRVKTLDQIGREIEEIQKLAPNRQIVFNDDNMFVYRKKSYEILESIKDYGIKYFAETDISIADDEKLLQLMQSSGCVMVFLGLESINPENLAEMNNNKWKLKRLQKYKQNFKKIQSFGINIIGSFIVGLENDTKESLIELKDYVLESNIQAQFSYLMPFPGTVWRDELIQKGRITPANINNWDLYTSYDAVLEPKKMTKQELVETVTEIWKLVYADEAKAKRMRQMIDIMKEKKLLNAKRPEEMTKQESENSVKEEFLKNEDGTDIEEHCWI